MKDFFPVVNSDKLSWNEETKIAQISSGVLVSLFNSRIPNEFFVRSEITGIKVLWEKNQAPAGVWIYAPAPSNDIDSSIFDWRIHVTWNT